MTTVPPHDSGDQKLAEHFSSGKKEQLSIPNSIFGKIHLQE